MNEVMINDYARCMVVCNDGAYEAEIVNKIVKAGKELGDWFKCKTLSELIAKKTGRRYAPSQIGQILSKITYYRLAEKRIVDDGTIKIEDTHWVADNDDSGESRYIEAFDANGRHLGEIYNPYYNRTIHGGHWEKYMRPIHAKHTEYRFI